MITIQTALAGRAKSYSMFTADELALLKRYVSLIDAELRRIGVSEADQEWIHAGSDRRPTEDMFVAHLAMLRGLPTGFGVVAYCAHLGFDYETTKRDIFGFDPGAG
jgi:hypothetical protein